MPNETTTQPLREQPPRSTDDTRLVAEVLGSDAAEEMDELVGDHSTDINQTESQGLELTEAETVATKEVEQRVSPEERKQQYFEWAGKINKDDNWVEKTFTFGIDGSVSTKHKLDLSYEKISELPPGLTYANGGLDLSFNNFTSLKRLPEKVNGNLDLSNNYSLASLEGLPKVILGDLYLKDIAYSAATIPAELTVTGFVFVDDMASNLAIDCKAKGYNVSTK